MKMKNLSLLLLTLTLFFISVYSQDIKQIQLVFRWPETYCNKDPKPEVGCNKIPPLKFTLVGFWGTDSNGKIVEKCPVTKPPNWKDVFKPDLVTQLDKFWPSLTKTDNKKMWQEAWETYGTCITKKLKGPTQYFNRAVRLAGEIGDLLQDHLIQSDGIVPCDSAVYNKDEILNSFKKVADENVVSFNCKKKNNTHAYLNQITFCYEEDPKKIVSCLVTDDKSCPPNIIVPRPSPPTPPPPPPPHRPSLPALASSLQTLRRTREKLRPIAYGRSFVN
ncbi:ribonuclease 3-like [Lycium barbarum]|uniref:ribonuclease 3-like n=1 Tax=Lycium barbarum TaxID=112863 RepID=UPI00293E5E09|nr:ribonuclease 3-like [Lycium barbarum]